MPSLEEVCQSIFSDGQWMRKMFIGGLLILSIIGIPLVLGYFYRYMGQVQFKGKLKLPEWEDLEPLFSQGLKVLLAFVIYVMAPLLIASLIGSIFTGFLGGFGVPFAMALHSLVLLVAPALVVSAMLQLQQGGEIKALFNYQKIVNRVLGGWRMLILPTLGLIGLITVTLPVCVFSFFLGFTAFIAYTLLVYARLEFDKR